MSHLHSTIAPRRIAAASVAVWCGVAGGLMVIDSAALLSLNHALAQGLGVVSIAIALLSIWPLSIAARGSQQQQAAQMLAGVMLSLALRSSLTILFAILMWKFASAPRQTVGLWTIFWYATLLATELVVVVRFAIHSNRTTLLTDPPVDPRLRESAAR